MTRLPLRIAALACTALLIGQMRPAHAAPSERPAIASDLIQDAVKGPRTTIICTGDKGAPIILIPGLSSPAQVWDGVVPDLARNHRVYVVQINGFAGDDPGDNLKPGILNGVVAEIHRFITLNKLQGAAVVGHSMGGLTALMLAKAHPADIGRMMIVDALPWYVTLFGPTATVAMIEPRAKAMHDQMAAAYGKPADPANAGKIADALALKPESRAKVKAWAMAADPRVTAEAMYEDLTTDLRPDMATIKAPITLVYPWNTAGPTRQTAETLYRSGYAAAPNVTLVDIGDAAHFVMLDQPEAFVKVLTAFAG